MGAREERFGLNEALFRDLNERAQQQSGVAAAAHPLEIYCECASLDCIERIRIDPTEYEAVRRDSTLFVVVPGHAAEDQEEVALSTDLYEVVRKHGDAGRVADALDPS